jgi:hypothetical protein
MDNVAKENLQDHMAKNFVRWYDEFMEDFPSADVTFEEAMQMLVDRYVELEEYELAQVTIDLAKRHGIHLD